MKRSNVGSSFDDFLAGEGLLAKVEARAIKHVVAWELRQALKKLHLSKAKLAKRMQTSRTAVNRLLDPQNASMTLDGLTRAAHAVGKRVEVRFVDAHRPPPRRRHREAGYEELRA